MSLSNVEIRNSLVRTPDGEVGECIAYHSSEGAHPKNAWAVVELPSTPADTLKGYDGPPVRVQWWPIHDLQRVVD